MLLKNEDIFHIFTNPISIVLLIIYIYYTFPSALSALSEWFSRQRGVKVALEPYIRVGCADLKLLSATLLTVLTRANRSLTFTAYLWRTICLRSQNYLAQQVRAFDIKARRAAGFRALRRGNEQDSSNRDTGSRASASARGERWHVTSSIPRTTISRYARRIAWLCMERQPRGGFSNENADEIFRKIEMADLRPYEK